MNIQKASKVIADLKPTVEDATNYLIAYGCILSVMEVKPNGCTLDDLNKITYYSLLPETQRNKILIDIVNDGEAEKVGDKYLYIKDFGQPITQEQK